MQRRLTPENITKLEANQIFVFGSNESGRHSLGAAKTALKWGAIMNIGEGIQGRTYGIPTKNYRIKTLQLQIIAVYIAKFAKYATEHPEEIFLVTKIGCGLAGYKAKDIAPYFKRASTLENVYLPLEFWEVLEK